MSDTVIKVSNLSKRYTIRHQQRSAGDGLRHALQRAVTAPWRALRSKFTDLRPPASDLFASKTAHRSLPTAHNPTEEDFWALQDVSFEVKRGEVLGIIGRNGAGKSTLLKILSRITEPTSGRIEIDGRVASLLEVGTGFHPELTGRENIFLNGAILGMSRAEVRLKFDEIVAFAEVEKFLDTPVKHYSSGMYVRLAFAVAAHLEPEILIVDEVLAVGDASFQQKCLGKMKDVSQQSGRTVLFVSHNMGAIAQLCEKALLLRSGQLLFSGSAETVLRTYSRSIDSTAEIRLQANIRKAASLLAIRFLDATQVESTIWNATEGGIFRIAYHITRALPRLEISLRLETVESGFVGTIFASRSSSGKIPSSKGDHEIKLKIGPQNLVPGTYHFTVWLHDPMRELFDFHEKIISLEITNTGTDFAPLGGIPLLGPFLIDPNCLIDSDLSSDKLQE